MTWYETLIGSFFEALILFFIMNLLNYRYLESIWKAIFLSFLTAGITTVTDVLFVPVGYLINYISFVILLSIFFNIKIIYVFFEFLFSLVILILAQLCLIFLSSKIGTTDDISVYERAIHLICILLISVMVGKNRKIQLKVRPYYIKYRKQLYLIVGNLFIISIIGLYIWDTDRNSYYGNIVVIIFFTLLWFALNTYLLKKLTDVFKQKKIILTQEQYIKMTQNIFDDSSVGESNEYENHISCEKGKIYKTKRIVLFTTDQGEFLINPDEIYYAEIKRNNCYLYTENQIFRILGVNLKEVMDTVNDEYFLRCHRYFAVNVKKILSIVKINYQLWQISFKEKKDNIYIKRKYYQELLYKYKQFANEEDK
jgi:DNA-binding LytR/AlgR family response regulator